MPPDVLHAPRFQDVLGDVADLLRGAIPVAHNSRFDASFLAAEFSSAGHTLRTVPTMCTLRLALGGSLS